MNNQAIVAMPQEIVLDMRLPSLNDIIAKNRRHWSKGALMKREVENEIILRLRQLKVEPIKQYPIDIIIKFVEPTKRRDVDNVVSGQKFILDALKKGGYIIDDSPEYIPQPPMTSIAYSKYGESKVIITIMQRSGKYSV